MIPSQKCEGHNRAFALKIVTKGLFISMLIDSSWQFTSHRTKKKHENWQQGTPPNDQIARIYKNLTIGNKILH
jgi:hypothetical protein